MQALQSLHSAALVVYIVFYPIEVNSLGSERETSSCCQPRECIRLSAGSQLYGDFAEYEYFLKHGFAAEPGNCLPGRVLFIS